MTESNNRAALLLSDCPNPRCQSFGCALHDDKKESPMTLYRSKPQTVEAIQFDGSEASIENCIAFAVGKIRAGYDGGRPYCSLLAGKNGAQGWVYVPVGHYLVNQPDDKSDVWPVEASYFEAKYETVDA